MLFFFAEIAAAHRATFDFYFYGVNAFGFRVCRECDKFAVLCDGTKAVFAFDYFLEVWFAKFAAHDYFLLAYIILIPCPDFFADFIDA